MELHPYLQTYMPQLTKLCDTFEVEELYLFGSLATNEFELEKSDVDFLVKFPFQKGQQFKGRSFLNFYMALNKLFDRKVDLLETDQHIRNPFLRNSIERSKIKIYDRKGTEVPG